MTELKKKELACLYISHRLALIDSIDLRGVDDDRSKSLIKPISQIGYNLENRFIQYFLQKQSKLDILWLDKFFKENYNHIKEIFGNYLFHPIRVTCCASCHTGTSATKKQEIQLQRNKYQGIFICKSCEKNASNIDNIDLSNKLFTGYGFYENKGIRENGRSMLGFAGRRIIIKKKTGEIILTNNLFSITSLHEVFIDKVKHRINCKLFWVNNFKEDELIKHLSKEEILSIKGQLNKAKELGHEI